MSAELLPLDEQRARQLTDRIRDAAGQLWSLLAEAHDQRAWAALGYDSFKTYVETELGMSKQRAYQILDQARVIAAITAAAGVESTAVDLSEREARDLKSHLELVIENVRDATVDTEPELKAEATRAAINETRQHIQEQNAEPRPTARPISKPDLGGGVSHPARYSDGLLAIFSEQLDGFWRVLDPFAGTGRIHLLEQDGFDTVGIEIEQPWANLHERTVHASALDMPFNDASFDAICTSPTYGNRLADHHEASDPEERRSYRHDLGRPLHEDNSGQLHWGPKYRAFHEEAWPEAIRVLRPGGRFVLNIKDHIRDGQPQPVSGWHVSTLTRLGLDLLWMIPVSTPGLRYGANRDARVEHEWVLVFDRPKEES